MKVSKWRHLLVPIDETNCNVPTLLCPSFENF
ncbi:hypothetical protein X772_28465 [Mesorhizobium sp. LSJC280B00]|nr:hypothetical protein X772_28465 [Mesorhizobium sp. LSJC280B00]